MVSCAVQTYNGLLPFLSCPFFLQGWLQTPSSSEIHSSNQCLLSVLWREGDRQGPSHAVVLKQVRNFVSSGLYGFDLRLALAFWRLAQIKWVYQKLWKFRCQCIGSPSCQEYFLHISGMIDHSGSSMTRKATVTTLSMEHNKVEEPNFLKRSSEISQPKPIPSSEASAPQYPT